MFIKQIHFLDIELYKARPTSEGLPNEWPNYNKYVYCIKNISEIDFINKIKEVNEMRYKQ